MSGEKRNWVSLLIVQSVIHRTIIRIVLTILVSSRFAVAENSNENNQKGLENPPFALPDLSVLDSINGIEVRQADRFWERWPLVTVRYRKDNGEQRFTYANQVAFEAMRRGDARYPDGSMFAKVAFKTQDDVLFPNSQVPATFSRLQLMLKDSKKFSSTDGWSYALFIRHQADAKSNDATTLDACHSCHRIAQSRDFVFSQLLFPNRTVLTTLSDVDFSKKFTPYTLDKLRKSALAALSAADNKETTVMGYQMPLFTGSLSESIGPLVRYASESKKTYVLFDKKNDFALVAKPLPSTKECKMNVIVVIQGAEKCDRPEGIIQEAASKTTNPPCQFQIGNGCDGVVTIR